jgi:hypothetical protein
LLDTLNITAANGQSLNSIGTTSRSFNKEIHKINVFPDSELAISLHSLADFANNGNSILFTELGFWVTNTLGEVICHNSKLKSDKLWLMPPILKQPEPHQSYANLFITNQFDAEFVAYTSACFGNPADSTFYKSALKGYFGNLPRLTAKMIHQNRPNSIPSAEGHLDRLRKKLRSTNPYSALSYNEDAESEGDEDVLVTGKQLYVKTIDLNDLTIEDKKKLAFYADATGIFPFESSRGNNYLLLVFFFRPKHCLISIKKFAL